MAKPRQNTKVMKLAEALLLRADLHRKLASLRERIGKNAVVQQGDRPAESPADLLKEADGVARDFASLIFKINRTNLHVKLGDGRTLTEAMAQRDALVWKHAIVREAIAGSAKEPERYGLKEIKWVKTVDVRKLQKQVEDLAKQLRLLNAALQEANWRAELME